MQIFCGQGRGFLQIRTSNFLLHRFFRKLRFARTDKEARKCEHIADKGRKGINFLRFSAVVFYGLLCLFLYWLLC